MSPISRIPSLFTITSYSQAPSLSDEFSEEDQNTFNTFKTESKLSELNKKNQSKVCHCKGSMCKCLSTENNTNQYCNNPSTKSLSGQPVITNAKSSECPIHSKPASKQVDINTLEESYWAQWKPSKCSEIRNDKLPDLPTKMCRMTSGSAKLNLDIPKMPVPNVNLGNYVQCKTCLKFIEKNPRNSVNCLHRNYGAMDIETSDADSRKHCTFQEDDGYTTFFDDYTTECTETDYTYGATQSEAYSNDKSHRCKCNALNNSTSNNGENGSITLPKHSERSKSRCERNSQKSKDSIGTSRTDRSGQNNKLRSFEGINKDYNEDGYAFEDNANPNADQVLYNNQGNDSIQSIPNLTHNQTNLNNEYNKNYKTYSSKHGHDQIDNDNSYDPFKQAYNSGNSESQSTNDYNTNTEEKNVPGSYEKYEYSKKQSASKVANEFENRYEDQQNRSKILNDQQNGSRTPTKYEINKRSRSNTPNKYSSGNKTPISIASKEYINKVANENNTQIDNTRNDQEILNIQANQTQQPNTQKNNESQSNERMINQDHNNMDIASPTNNTTIENSKSHNLVTQESKPSYIYNINSVTTPRVLKGHSYPLKPVAKKEKRSTSMSRPVSKNMYKFKK